MTPTWRQRAAAFPDSTLPSPMQLLTISRRLVARNNFCREKGERGQQQRSTERQAKYPAGQLETDITRQPPSQLLKLGDQDRKNNQTQKNHDNPANHPASSWHEHGATASLEHSYEGKQ